MRACSTCSVQKTLTPTSIQGAVTNVYRTRSSTIKLSWSRTQTGSSLSVYINNNLIPIANQKGRFKCALSKSSSFADICWDFVSAKYSFGPEPISNYYVVVIIDNEFAVLAGDKSKDFAKGFSGGVYKVGEFWMVSRMVQVVGRAMYSTRARFYEEGKEHEIMVRFEGEVMMGIYVDERKVVEVKRLRWNFRGMRLFSSTGWRWM